MLQLLYKNTSHVIIKLKEEEGVGLVIEDNGRGMDTKNFHKGFSNNKIVLLTDFYDGTVDIDSVKRELLQAAN